MDKPITRQELKSIEQVLDKLFSKLDIDIEFTKHFFDRLNDARNKQQITKDELIQIYKSLYDKFGIEIAKEDSEIEELIKSVSTNVNIPVNIYYNHKTKQVELTAKTIMRKKDFKSTSPVLRVESFKEYLLSEKAITFGNQMYPKFGQVVITAGGAGSGKGFVSSKLMGIEGRIINVDDTKEWVLKTTELANKIKNQTGVDITKLSLKNADDVSTLHDIISGMNITSSVEKNIFTSIATSAPDRKPNLIFDVTLKDLGKLEKISRSVTKLGYNKENIHIVWIVNSFQTAKEQNQTRSRTVSDSILLATHKGAAVTMYDLIHGSNDINVKQYMDGDIWIAFNKAGVDTNIVKSNFGGKYVKDAEFVKVKAKGQAPKISADVSSKIASYVPKTETWK